MSNPVGSLSEGTVYGSRIGMTENSLAILERNRSSGEPWDLGQTKPNMEALERSIPSLYFSCFDMLLTEDATWLVKVSEASQALTVPMARIEPQEEPEQCPVIDSQEQGVSPVLEGQEEERSLEQVQSMVVGEVLKDIETACKLLNITPGRLPSNTPATAFCHLIVTIQRHITDKVHKAFFRIQKELFCLLVAGKPRLSQQYLSYWILLPKSTHVCVDSAGKMTDLLNHILTDAKLCLPASRICLILTFT